MKHLYIFILAIMTCVACSNVSSTKTQDASNNSTQFSSDSIRIIDSLYIGKTYEGDSAWMHTNYTCTYPVTDNPDWQKAKQNILYWICDIFNDSKHTNWNNIEQVAAHYGDSIRNRVKEDMALESGFLPCDQFEQSIDIAPVFENDTIITYGKGIYTFLGGAHGGYYYVGTSFNKNTGHQYNFDLLSKYDKETLNKMIINGLGEYFSCTQEALADMIDVEDIYNIPLPSTPPYITENGIAITYQQYEIACYAAGMPSFVIPLGE